MLNVTKKAVFLLSIFILCSALNSCAYEQRTDFSECIKRINAREDIYEALIEEAFFSEGEWFLFVDTLTEDDILINGKEDENRLLTSLCISVINIGNVSQPEVFRSFCESAVYAFTQNADTEKIIEDSHIFDENVIFSDKAYFSENGRYKTSFFNADLGSTFVIELLY